MRIAVFTHHLYDHAGSEHYTCDISQALASGGHDIIVYSPDVGPVAGGLIASGVCVTDSPHFPSWTPDIAHVQHNVMALLARQIFPTTPMVFVSHGILPALEQPPSLDFGVSKWVAVSDEVADNLYRKGVPRDRVAILPNPVDLAVFAPGPPARHRIQRVLVMSNRATDETLAPLLDACGELGAVVVRIGLPNDSVHDVRPHILASDLVVTVGRGVLEALACGRNVLVYDLHGGDGLVTPHNFELLRRRNFSGRTYARKYNRESLLAELACYDPELPYKLGPTLSRDHSLPKVVEQLERLYAEALADPVPTPVLPPGSLVPEVLELERLLVERSHQVRALSLAGRQPPPPQTSQFVGRTVRVSKKAMARAARLLGWKRRASC